MQRIYLTSSKRSNMFCGVKPQAGERYIKQTCYVTEVRKKFLQLMKPFVVERWKTIRDASHVGLPELHFVDSSNPSLEIHTKAFLLIPRDICTLLIQLEINDTSPSVCVAIWRLLRVQENTAMHLLLWVPGKPPRQLSIPHLSVTCRSCEIFLKKFSLIDDSRKASLTRKNLLFTKERFYGHRFLLYCLDFQARNPQFSSKSMGGCNMVSHGLPFFPRLFPCSIRTISLLTAELLSSFDLDALISDILAGTVNGTHSRDVYGKNQKSFCRCVVLLRTIPHQRVFFLLKNVAKVTCTHCIPRHKNGSHASKYCHKTDFTAKNRCCTFALSCRMKLRSGCLQKPENYIIGMQERPDTVLLDACWCPLLKLCIEMKHFYGSVLVTNGSCLVVHTQLDSFLHTAIAPDHFHGEISKCSV